MSMTIRAAILCLLALASPCRADVVVVVGSGSSVDKISEQDASLIFLGKSVSFPNGSPATPVFLAESNPLREKFDSEVLKKNPAELKSYWSKMAFTGRAIMPHEYASAADIKKAVAENPKLVGYIDKGDVDSTIKVIFSK